MSRYLVLALTAGMFAVTIAGSVHAQGLGFQGALVSVADGSRMAQVHSVSPGGMAQRMGVMPGDVILSINSFWPGNAAWNQRAIGAGRGTVTLLVNRQGRTFKLGNRRGSTAMNNPFRRANSTSGTNSSLGAVRMPNKTSGTNASLGGPTTLNGHFRITNKARGSNSSLGGHYGTNDYGVRMVESGNYAGQIWKVTPAGGGYVRLTNRGKGTQFSMGGNIVAKPAAVQMTGTSEQLEGQLWKITPAGGGYYRLTNKAKGGGMSLGGNVAGTTSVHMTKTSTNLGGQLWKFTRVK